MKKSAIGLLKRATKLHEHTKASEWQASLSLPEKDEGLTEEERRAIIASIDEIASRNSISGGVARPSAAPLKKGFVFPLVVNVLALVFTAAVLASLALIFHQRDQGIVEGNAVVTTAEGKLIQEIKRDSESKLQEKDKAISEIRLRLSSIDKQRSELAATIDQRIDERERELRAAMQAELDKERSRLAGQGLSEKVIQERMKKFEAQKNAEFDRQIDEFRKRAAADKAAEEAKLAEARAEYQRNISGLNDERKKILDDAKKSEERLRSSLEARTKELEGQGAAARASLAAAQSELARLQDQRGKSQAAEDRILGLYGSIRVALRERRFEDALASVDALNAYLNDPALAAVPSLKARREADLFIADALGSLARSELERASVDVTKLLGQAELLAAAREASAAGNRALKAGDLAAAAASYRASLEAVPEILAAHDYFIAASKEAEAAKNARLESALADAERAWKAGDRGEASRRYAEALAMLPLDEAQRGAMLSRLGQVDPKTAAAASRAQDSAAARGSYASAVKSLKAGTWTEAIPLFIGLIGSYPAAEQVPDALKGIETARAGMESDFEARAAAYEKTIADLRSEAGRATSSLQGQSASLDAALQAEKDARASAETSLAEAQRKLTASRAEVARLQKQLEAVAAASADASVKSGAVASETAALAAASAADAQALAELRAQSSALRQEYADYMKAEGAASGQAGDFAVVERQKRLVGFLGGKEVKALFPELGGIVDSQFNAYRQQLSMETLRTAADIAIQAATAKTAREKQAALDANAKHYAGDPTIAQFIAALRDQLK